MERLLILNAIHIFIDSESNEYDDIEMKSRSMLDPPLSDIDFKKMVWVGTTLKETRSLSHPG